VFVTLKLTGCKNPDFGESHRTLSELDYIQGEQGYFKQRKSTCGISNKVVLFERATYDEIVNWLHFINKVEFKEGDIVWYKGDGIRKECGAHKFKVLKFSLVSFDDHICDSYLEVALENIDSGNTTAFLTTHLELYKEEEKQSCCDGKVVEIEGKKYKLVAQ
jgi:hypothetical protein